MSIESVYGSLLRRSPDEGAYGTYAGWSDDDIANAIYGSQEYANLQQQQQPQEQPQQQQEQPQQQGGGGVNVDQINQLYQQYLGRGADQGGINTYMGMDYGQLANILNTSPERQNYLASQQQQQPQQQQQAPANNSGDINAIYQQYLGRAPDQGALQTYAGWSPDQITNAILSSQEYANRGGASNAGQPAASNANPQDLANQVFSLYRTNQNYDQLLNQLNAAPQNADYYRARIGLIGNQMGWQQGQNTAGNNATLQNELNSYMAGAKAAGLSDAEINSLIGTNAATQSAVNQERIASDAKGPQGWVNQNIPGGYTTLAALAAAGLGAGALGAFDGLGALAAEGAAVPISEITGSTFGGSAFTLPELATATGTGLTAGSGYAGVGLNPAIQTGGELAYGGVGLNPAITGSTGVGLNATIPGITSGLATSAGALAAASGIPITADIFGAAGGLTASQSAALDAAITAGDYATASSLLPAGSTLAKLLAPAAKALTTATTANKAAQTSSLLPNLLRQGTGTMGGSAQAALPGIYREPFNPFAFGNQQPVQGTNKGFDFLSALSKEGAQPSMTQASSAQPSSATARNQLLANLLF